MTFDTDSVDTLDSQIYKGYVRSRGKAPMGNFRDPKNLVSIEEANGMDSYCGILADGIVMLDIDDMKAAKTVLEMVQDSQQSAHPVHCRVLRTDHGMHFYFKDPTDYTASVGIALAVGVPSDVKTGKRNGADCLRLDGRDREVVFETPELGPVPVWLAPLGKKYEDIPHFLGMKQGDGRNNALFSYKPTLARAGFDGDQIFHLLRLINNYLFEEPLSDDEVANVGRREKFESKPKGDSDETKGVAGRKTLAEEIIAKRHIVRYNGRLYFYSKGCYVSSPKALRSAVYKECPEGMSAKLRDEVMRNIEDILYDDELEEPEDVPYAVVFDNGWYDGKTGTFHEGFDPSVFAVTRVPWDWDDSPCEQAEAFIASLSDDQSFRRVIAEIAASCLYRRADGDSKMYMLIGDGANGKSVFLKLLKMAMGKDNCSSVTIQALADSNKQYATSLLYGKSVCLFDDMPSKYIDDTGVLKTITTGGDLDYNEKYGGTGSFTPFATVVFATNEPPMMTDLSKGMMRRIIAVPFQKDFGEGTEARDPEIEHKVLTPECAKWLLHLGCVTMTSMIADGWKRTRMAEGVLVTEQMAEDSNPALWYRNLVWDTTEHGPLMQIEDLFLGRSRAEVYQEFVDAWREDGRPLNRIMNQNRFSRAMDRINGTYSRVVKYGDPKVPTRVYARGEIYRPVTRTSLLKPLPTPLFFSRLRFVSDGFARLRIP